MRALRVRMSLVIAGVVVLSVAALGLVASITERGDRVGAAATSAEQSTLGLYGAGFLVLLVVIIGLLSLAERAGRAEIARLRDDEGDDVLTGLSDWSQLHHAYATLRPRRRRPVGVLYVELDRIQPISDFFGLPLNDDVLYRVGQRLRETVRDGDVVARLDGDEFALLIPGTRNISEIMDVAERVVTALNRTLLVDDREVDMGASVGASIVTSSSVPLAAALRDAHAALFATNKPREDVSVKGIARAESPSASVAPN